MKYQWLAYYTDGSWLPQFNDDGSENKYADIDRFNLARFVVETQEPSPRIVLVLHIPLGATLIYRQRVQRAPGNPEKRVWVVGVRRKLCSRDAQMIAAIFEDGRVEMTDRWDDSVFPFREPIPQPEEQRSRLLNDR